MPTFVGGGDSSRAISDVTLPENINQRLSAVEGDRPIVREFYGENTTETVTHNKGRQVSVTFSTRDGESMPVECNCVDENTVIISSVLLLDGFALII